MKPYLLIGETKITVFPLILLAATYICMIYCVKSTQNSIEYYRDIFKLVLTCMVFVFYGGLTGGCIGLVVYCKREHKQIWEYMDLILSIVPLGQAIGRIGCYFNGCCYGRKYDGILSVPYPVDGEISYVFPTWFCESAFSLALFSIFIEYANVLMLDRGQEYI